MKRLSIFKIMAVLVTLAFIFAMCTKETSTTRLNPTLATTQSKTVTWDSATVVGYVVAAGSGFSERGICYSTVAGPTTASTKAVYSKTDNLATFTIRLGGLTRLTKYYAKAYAINATETIYGEELSFTTTAAMPTIADITTSAITVTRDSAVTAATAINITDDGGPDPTANIISRGVVYGFSSHPTTDSSKTTEGTGKGQFNSLALNLKGNKKYYLRAYATNKIGTTYSNEVNFTTPAVIFGAVKTNSPTNIAKTSVTFNGLVTYNGGGTISDKGFVYGLTSNPTLSSTKVAVVTTKDSITSDITGLTSNTTYHVRAYVTNQAGTYYGADVSFNTLADITKLWVVGDYNGWTNSDAAKFIISTITSGGAAEGYVWLTTGGIKLVTDHSWDNAHTFGDDGSSTGKLGNVNGGSNIVVATSGYYLIKADLGAMTYSLTQTTWGIIGDATAGGWGTQTDMTYYPSTGVFGIYANLASTGHFKFRGTSDWNINFGSTAADGKTLDYGGGNIAVPATANYAITLDLSVPNQYTYRIDSTWSIIGDATPGGWSNDTKMTWDAVNGNYTVTVAMLGTKAFKFRANNDWGVNYGGSLTGLTSGGANIVVAADGTYTITFNPWTLVGTIAKKKK